MEAPIGYVQPLPASIVPRVPTLQPVDVVPGRENDWGPGDLLADLKPFRRGGETLPMPGDLRAWEGGRGDAVSKHDWSTPQFQRVDGSFDDALAGAAALSRASSGGTSPATAQAVLVGSDGKHYLAALGAPTDLRAQWPYYSSGTQHFVWQTEHLPAVGQPVEGWVAALAAIVDGDRYVDMRQ